MKQLAAGLCWLPLFTVTASTALAHPLGNSSITHFDILNVSSERTELILVLDIAEEPSRVIRAGEIDANRDGDDTIEEQKAWLASKAAELAPSLRLTIDGRSIPLQPVGPDVITPSGKREISQLVLKIPGVMEMPTYRLMIRYAAAYPERLEAGEHTLAFEDATYTGTPGLRRILLERTAGVHFGEPRPSFMDEGEDPFIYEQYDPGNLPNEHSTTFKFTIGPAAASLQPVATRPAASEPAETATPPGLVSSLTDPRNDPARSAASYRDASRLIALLQGRWGVMTVLTVTLLAFFWGVSHALMPGHAKTVVAAYLISQHGTYRHAILLAIIVTITHTALVIVVGLIIWFYQASNPDLGPVIMHWLGTIGGALVATMGLTLIWRGLAGRLHHHHSDHDHHHGHHHDHGHEDHHHHAADDGAAGSSEHGRSWLRRLFIHSHPHVHTHDHTQDVGVAKQISLKLLVMMGITGGIVPCPTAMIIMLLGILTNVVPGALYAVCVFSLGLALTLMIIGFLALTSRRYAAKVLLDAGHEGPRSQLGQTVLLRLLPAISGAVVTTLGLAITAHYLYMMRTGLRLFEWL